LDRQSFNLQIKKAGLSKKEFCELLGLAYNTVNGWGSSGKAVPLWVESWLNLYIENKACKELKEAIKKSGVCE